MANLTDYGFPWNDVSSDRTYNASVWQSYFGDLFENGVLPGVLSQLEVVESSPQGKTFDLKTGSIIINGIMFQNDTEQTFTLEDNTSGSVRIDRVIARADYDNRLVEFTILKGTAGAGAPALTQTSTVHELSLASVTLANNYSSVTDSGISDERIYSKTIGQELFESENNFSQYDKDVISVDADNMPTEVEYSRTDGTLAIKQVASNADSNGYYQTIVETFYDTSEILYKTHTYTLTYLSNGIIDTSSKVVSY